MIVVKRSADGIATVLLNNPARRNALSGEMFEQLANAWRTLGQDDTVRVVVVTGEGEAFCAGADLTERLHERVGIDQLIDEALIKTTFFPKPLVAAINGHCVAGGLELVLAADIRIVSRTAQLGFPEVRWGILPSGGGAMKLLDQLPHTFAMDLLLTARLISGEEAVRIGLASLAVEPCEVLPLAMERARMIARNSPMAVQATKQAALTSRITNYASREDFERDLVELVRNSGHQDEGIAAFLARREPAFAAASPPNSTEGSQ